MNERRKLDFNLLAIAVEEVSIRFDQELLQSIS